jgi:hypothetical protein
MKHKLSTPPTTTASHKPAVIQRDALAKTLALDEQAVEIDAIGPRSFNRRRTTSLTENKFWV